MNKNMLILRIRLNLSEIPSDKNFITKYINFNKINTVPNSFTIIEDLFPHIPSLLDKNVTGILNFVNPGLISPFKIVKIYNQLSKSSKKIEGTIIKDSSNCFLDTTKLVKLIPEINCINNIIHKIIQNYIDNEKKTD